MKTSESIKKLSEKLPDSAIQRADKAKTKKAYDTTGYGYQSCIDRFNEIMEDQWGFTWDIIHQVDGKYASGVPFIDLTVQVNIWVEKSDNIRACVGSHTARNFGDALKGAITNGFKKTASFWGVGRHAYLGVLDDDHILPDSDVNKIASLKKLESKPKVTEVNKSDRIQPERSGAFSGEAAPTFDGTLKRITNITDSTKIETARKFVNNCQQQFKAVEYKTLLDTLDNKEKEFKAGLFDASQIPM